MKKSLAFTLAEVLITLAIIGVVAAMAIPAVIANTNQAQFKTGLQKAVSVLNSAITMNVALESETPYDNEDLFEYLQQHMSIMSSTTKIDHTIKITNDGEDNSEYAGENKAFYTSDGFRFEIPQYVIPKYLHENITEDDEKGEVSTSAGEGNHSDEKLSFNGATKDAAAGTVTTGQCGAAGFKANTDTTRPPCLILVDVNGDKKPTPKEATAEEWNYKYPKVTDKLINDIFPIIITDERAVPYGVIAQRAMYQGKDKKSKGSSSSTSSSSTSSSSGD